MVNYFSSMVTLMAYVQKGIYVFGAMDALKKAVHRNDYLYSYHLCSLNIIDNRKIS